MARWFGQNIGVRGTLDVRGAAFSYSIDVSQNNYVQFSSGFVSVTGVQARMSYDAGDDRLVTYDAAATWQYYVTRADLKTVSANINVAAVAFPVAQTTHGFVEGTPLNETASGYVVADNTDPAKNCDVIVAVVVDANNFIAIQAGKLTLTTGQWDAICGTSGGLSKGENYWLGGAGTMTATQPTTYLQPLIKALSTTEALVAIGDMVAAAFPTVANWNDLRNYSCVFDDMDYVANSADIMFGVFVSGSGAAVSYIYEAGHPGIIGLSTGTTTTGTCRFMNSYTGTSGRYNLGNGLLELTFWFKTPSALSDATNSYTLTLGLRDVISGTSSDEITLSYTHSTNSGKFYLSKNVAGAGLGLAANGNVTVAASTWYRVKIQVNSAANAVNVYVKTGTGAEILDISYSGALPATSIGLGPFFMISKSAGGTARIAALDAFQVLETLSAER